MPSSSDTKQVCTVNIDHIHCMAKKARWRFSTRQFWFPKIKPPLWVISYELTSKRSGKRKVFRISKNCMSILSMKATWDSCLKFSRHMTRNRPSIALPIDVPSPWRPELLIMRPSLSYVSKALTPSKVLQTIANIVSIPKYSERSLHSRWREKPIKHGLNVVTQIDTTSQQPERKHAISVQPLNYLHNNVSIKFTPYNSWVHKIVTTYKMNPLYNKPFNNGQHENHLNANKQMKLKIRSDQPAKIFILNFAKRSNNT